MISTIAVNGNEAHRHCDHYVLISATKIGANRQFVRNNIRKSGDILFMPALVAGTIEFDLAEIERGKAETAGQCTKAILVI